MAKRKQLRRLFDQQKGLCFYCDGATWLPSRETPDQARIRLGLPDKGTPGGTKMLRATRATREHLVKIVNGGKSAGNLKMACHACNVRRMDSEPEAHRMDMQVLVAAGLHPTNRPPVIDSPREHMKRGLKALHRLRMGEDPI